ncbi:hypothetical protein LJC64_03285 [Ruminococcaceae bacterium OttesenSCG-928-A11]|nr:hypothetical protein [Ruminococcaceae bacterium OttesenSCG-928-A11]
MSEKMQNQSSNENSAAKEWAVTVLQPERPEYPETPDILHDVDVMMAMEKRESQLTDEERDSIQKYKAAEEEDLKASRDFQRKMDDYRSGAYASGPRGLVVKSGYPIDKDGKRIEDTLK